MGAQPTSEARRPPSSAACPRCGAEPSGHGGWRCLPLGRVLALIGGLALLAAYLMPWFGVSLGGQGIVLSGEFLGRFLGSATDLRRFMPGASGDPNEVLALRALVGLFPASGLLAVLLVLAGQIGARWRRATDVALLVVGLVPLIAVLLGLSRLPP